MTLDYSSTLDDGELFVDGTPVSAANPIPVSVSGIVADVDLDIEASDLGAGAAAAACGNGVMQHLDDGTGKRIAALGDASGHQQVDVLTAPAIRALTNADVVTAEVSKDAVMGTTADGPSTDTEDTTVRTGISLWKGVKNYLKTLAGAQYTEDVAAATDPVGPVNILVRQDTLAADSVNADGDNIAQRGTNKGQAHVYCDGAVALASGTAQIGSLVTPVVAAETVVAGAASTLGKIGTVAAAAILFVRCPCAAAAPATARIDWRISANKSHTITFYRARSVLNAPTLVLTSVLNGHTVVINGLTFTAHTDTTVEATGQFSIAGDDAADAAELVKCINTRFAALGLSAAVTSGSTITLTATTATVAQCVAGQGTIVCAQNLPLTLASDGAAISGCGDNSTTAGRIWPQYIDGYPQAYVGIQNNDGAAAMTVVVGATLLPV